jgi:hypothetical protein
VLVDAQNYKEFLHELRRPPSTATNSDAATTVAQDVEMADTQSERREGGGSPTAPPRTPPSISAPPSTGDGEIPTAHTKNPFSKKTFAVSLSPQSTASLAARYLLTMEQSARKLTTFLKQLGVSKVYDSSFGRALSLVESRREFHERIVQATAGGSGGGGVDSAVASGGGGGAIVLPKPQVGGAFPVLASACPGWICLAEKKYRILLLDWTLCSMMQYIVSHTCKLEASVHATQMTQMTLQ